MICRTRKTGWAAAACLINFLSFGGVARAADEPAEFRFAKIIADNLVLQQEKSRR